MSFRGGEAAPRWGLITAGLRRAPQPVRCCGVHAGQRWSADEVGGHRPQQERAGPGPGGGRGGRDDDAGAGSSLDQAGDLLVVVAADPGEVVVDDARSGAAAELDPLGGGVLVRRRRVIGAQQPKPERGPAPQPLAALPGGGVEVEPEGAARAEPGGRDGVGVPGERPQRGRVGQHGSPVRQRQVRPPGRRRRGVQRRERPPGRAPRRGERDDRDRDGDRGGDGDRGQRVPAAPRGAGGHCPSPIPEPGARARTGRGPVAGSAARGGRRLDVAVAIAGAAVVVGVLVAAVALRDGIGGLGGCHGRRWRRGRGGRRRRRRGDRGVRRRGLGVTVRRTGRLGRGGVRGWVSGRAARGECHRERGGGWQRQQHPGMAAERCPPGKRPDHCFSLGAWAPVPRLSRHRVWR